MAPSTEPVVLVASATDIMSTTYIQPITTRYTTFLAARTTRVSLLDADTKNLGKIRNLSPEGCP